MKPLRRRWVRSPSPWGVLLVEQKLPFARRVAQDLCIMDRGRTVAAGAMPELSDELVRRHLTV